MEVALNEFLSKEIRDWLTELADTRVGSVNACALEASVDPSQLGKILRGKLRASETVLVKIAPLLGLAPERLVLLATIDRSGGFAAFLDHLPEAPERLGLQAASTRRAVAEAAQASAIATFAQPAPKPTRTGRPRGVPDFKLNPPRLVGDFTAGPPSELPPHGNFND